MPLSDAVGPGEDQARRQRSARRRARPRDPSRWRGPAMSRNGMVGQPRMLSPTHLCRRRSRLSCAPSSSPLRPCDLRRSRPKTVDQKPRFFLRLLGLALSAGASARTAAAAPGVPDVLVGAGRQARRLRPDIGDVRDVLAEHPRQTVDERTGCAAGTSSSAACP